MDSKNRAIFSLLLAPPAWGKTSLLIELFSRQLGPWVYLSPLRALADEFYHRVKNLVNTYYLKSQSDLEKLLLFKENPPRLVIGTPETLGLEGAAWAEKLKAHFVLDEIHLFYLWGESFRPWLREYLYVVGNTGQNILGLTATFSDEWLEQCREEFSQAGYKLHIQDQGNFKWAHPPRSFRYYGFRGRSRLRRNFLAGLERGETSLLFCQTRRDVHNWVDFCQRKRISVIGCTGGGVDLFREQLRQEPRPLSIVCTSVLGHGVNLPTFDAVYLDLIVDHRALWLQMAARGGRRGEGFVLHCLNWPNATSSRRIFYWWKTILSDEICQWVL